MTNLPEQLGQTEAAKPVAFGRVLIVMAAGFVVLAGLRAAGGFFIPILLAAFIATASVPMTDWLRRHKVPRSLAVAITVLVDFAFLAAIVFVGFSLLGDLQGKWETKYQGLLTEKVADLAVTITEILEKWKVEGAKEKVDAYFKEKSLESLKALEFSQVWTLSTDLVGRVAKFLGTAFIVFILTVFMLTEARMFGRRLSAIRKADGPNFQRLMSAVHDIQKFLGIKTIISLFTGVLAGFVCWLAGLDFPILWGIVAFGMNYIPVVGSVFAGLPPVILALLVQGGWSAFAVGLCYVLINIALGNLVEPMLMGRRFGLSTLVVITSVLFWGWIWGPVGMLLAVPITMMLKVGLDNSSDFRWIAIAISKERGPEKKLALPATIPVLQSESDTTDAPESV